MTKFKISIFIFLVWGSLTAVGIAQVNSNSQSKREIARQTLNEALRSYVKGEIPKAREGLKLAISQDPSYPYPRFNLAVIAAAEEDWASAIQWFEEFLKLDGTSDLAERAKSQLKELKQVAEMDKTPEGKRQRQYETALSTATWLLEIGLLKEAITQASIASKINAQGWQPYALTASALLKNENWDEAIKFVNLAIERAPADTKLKLKSTIEQIEKERQKHST